MRRPSKPLLIAGIPIAGLALASYHGSGRTTASAWSPSPVSSTTAAASTRLRSSSVVLLHSSTSTNTDEVDLTSLNLTPELTMMTTAFSSIPDEKTRHKQLLYMASKLPSVENIRDTLMIGENKVPGCLSTVYVDCTLDKKKVDGNGDDSDDNSDSGEEDVMVVNYHGDSDGLLTKGLLALLIRGLNGNTPQSIQKVDPNFIQAAKISQTLTPGRNNGFLNMLAVMKRKAMEKLEEYESGIVNGGEGSEGEEEVVVNEKEESVQQQEEEDSSSNNNDSIVTSFDEIEGKPMYNTIMSTLIPILKPTSISLIDNSSQHDGHAGSKGWAESGESHFALRIVADVFDGLSLVKRHQLIYMLLGDTMEKIHALEIKAMSPDEV